MTKTYIDLTLDFDEAFKKFSSNEMQIKHFGHLGTHVDIMDSNGLPPERMVSTAHLFHVKGKYDDVITAIDLGVRLANVKAGDTVMIHTGWLKETYETDAYFKHHPTLSQELIDDLLARKVNMIAIDAPGIKRFDEHKPIDEYCMKHSVYILENIPNVEQVKADTFTLHCFPIKFPRATGNTCRVVAMY